MDDCDLTNGLSTENAVKHANNRIQQVETVLAFEDDAHDHTWVVFSTALQDGWLMLQCVDCGLHGVVKNPTKKEWSTAFHAPSKPYQWTQESRIVAQPQVSKGKRYVVRQGPLPKCECYERRGIVEPVGFERFPNELTRPPIHVTSAEREEFDALGCAVIAGQLCSFLFQHYLESFERDTGMTHCSAVKEIANRISRLDRKGMHCSPSIVARLLTEIAIPFQESLAGE